MRDDIKTAEDIANILKTEVPNHVIATPALAPGSAIGTTARYFETAETAAKIHHENHELDYILRNQNSPNAQRLSQAVEQGANAARFKVSPTIKQTVKITAIDERTPA